MHFCTVASAHTFPTTPGASFKPITDNEDHAPGATVKNVGKNGHPKLGAYTTGLNPEPEGVLLTLESDSNYCINGSISDLSVPDLHDDRIDENRNVNAF